MTNLPEVFSSVRHFSIMPCSPRMKSGQANKPGVELITNSRTETMLMGLQDLKGHVKTPLFICTRKISAQISCLYLQYDHHQILNPQGLPFYLLAMSLHFVLGLCWQECRGPGRVFKVLMRKVVMQEPHLLLEVLQTV